jgi:hypothetical protein
MTWTQRVLVVLIVGFFLFYLITQPESAASGVKIVFSGLGEAFRAVVRFFSSLAG